MIVNQYVLLPEENPIHMYMISTSCLCVPGRIKAAQLEYSEAHKHLVQAMRKAPQQSAVGFRQTVSLAYCHKRLFTGPEESSTKSAVGFRQTVSLACCHKHIYRPWVKLHRKVPLVSDRRWVLFAVTNIFTGPEESSTGKCRWFQTDGESCLLPQTCLQATRKAPQQSAIGFRQLVSLACCHKPLFTGHEKSSTAADSESFSAGSHIITSICQIMQVTQMTDDTAVLNGAGFIWSSSMLERRLSSESPFVKVLKVIENP